MLKALIRGSGSLFAATVPFEYHEFDKVSKSSKTAAEFYNRPVKQETGKERLYAMFSIDEFGCMSTEITSIYQTSFLAFLVGAVYGGFIQSRSAYMDFMESNQATAYKSHLDAKKKLQDQVTINFAKGAVRWGWRLSLFTTTYVGIVTTISVYRGKSSVYEYLSAGTIAGAMYKVNNGLRGMTVGGLLGCALGGIAGLISIGLLKYSGTSMEEVRYWQYNWKRERDQAIKDAMDANPITERDPLLDAHAENVAVRDHTLENLEQNADKKVNAK